MAKKNFFLKLLSVLIALILTLKYILLRRVLPFKKLIKKDGLKKGLLNLKRSIIIRASNRVFKIFFIRSCFTKSLVIHRFLRLSGISSTIEIGINESNSKISSHCWVKTDGFYTESLSIRKRYKVLKV